MYNIIKVEIVIYYDKNKGGINMDIQFGMSIIMILYLGVIMAIAGLGIYTLILAIKALKIYIKNNSHY